MYNVWVGVVLFIYFYIYWIFKIKKFGESVRSKFSIVFLVILIKT